MAFFILVLAWLAGWSTLPLAQRLWENSLPDAGVAAGRVLCLCLWTLAAYWLGHAGVAVHISALMIFPVFAIGFYFAWREREVLREILIEKKRGVVVSEALFFFVFAFFLALRGFWPDINDGEKPMDMALLSTLSRADSLPPANPFAAGLRLTTYYYFGHLQGALLTEASFSSARASYNVLCALLPALIFSSLFSLCAALTKRVATGVLACGVVLLCGTLAPLRFWLPDILGAPLDPRAYFSTSRVIPLTINEYPFFTSAQGDLHAHFWAMPIAVLVMTLGWALYRHGASTLPLLMSAVALAALLLTNIWDFPIYGLLIFACVFRREQFRKSSNAVLGIAVIALALSYPFWSRLQNSASGRGIVWPPDFAVDSWLLIWLPFLVLLAVGFRKRGATREYSFAGRLALCGLMALLVCEVFWTGYLPQPFHRQDTVFKFGLQAWFLLGTGAVCGAMRVLPPRGGVLVLFALFAIPLYSSLLTLQARAQNFEAWRGLDAWSHLALPERAAAQWLYQNARDGDAILEAEKHDGGDYTEYSRYAHATGVPAVIGPQAHSFQWIGNWEEVFARKDAARAFYLSDDETLRAAVAQRYRVRWVILGELERREYGAQNIARLEQTLPIMARFGNENDPHRVVICRALS